jgi:site-specific DNA-methyltransferase (cytosine-N4-specific)
MPHRNHRGSSTKTRLSRLHPYPAMVADELALAIVEDHVPENLKVLDPFCGSGRLLAAAESAAVRVGTDVNPLAWLLTKAKFARADDKVIGAVLENIERGKRSAHRGRIRLDQTRKVEWFAPEVIRELDRIVTWINNLDLPEPEQLLVASALSATAWEVSYARRSGWKLHRQDAVARSEFKACPCQQLERRLQYCLKELQTAGPVQGEVIVELVNARSLGESGESVVSTSGPYDIVLTSPPYGDSRTTVQYGAASSLCLSVASRLRGLDHLSIAGRIIDGACLGGRSRRLQSIGDLKRYWAGSLRNKAARSVVAFLEDYDETCAAISANLTAEGKAILILGRRSTGGYRLKLDRFTVDRLEARGLHLVSRTERSFRNKHAPRRINRFARSHSKKERTRGTVTTMAGEIILVMKKRPEFRVSVQHSAGARLLASRQASDLRRPV